jgi:hypothetical protein
MFSLLHNFQAGFGAHLSPGVKRPRCEVDHSLPSSAQVKNGGTTHPLRILLQCVVLN